MFIYFTIEEILPKKFALKLTEAISNDWELTEIISDHSSGFTVHKAKLKKYEKLLSKEDNEFKRIFNLISNRNSLPVDPRLEELKEVDRIVNFIVPSSELDTIS